MLQASNVKLSYLAKVASVACSHPRCVHVLAIRFCRIGVLFKTMVVEKDSGPTGGVQKTVLGEETHISRFHGFVFLDFTDLLFDAYGKRPSGATSTFCDL